MNVWKITAANKLAKTEEAPPAPEEGKVRIRVTKLFLNGTDADEGHYWAVYTSLETLDGVAYSDPSYGTWEYKNKQLFGASYGVSGLPLVAGEWYALVYQPL